MFSDGFYDAMIFLNEKNFSLIHSSIYDFFLIWIVIWNFKRSKKKNGFLYWNDILLSFIPIHLYFILMIWFFLMLKWIFSVGHNIDKIEVDDGDYGHLTS